MADWKGWRKSSHSLDNGTCVEVRRGDDGVSVRDSTDPDGPVLIFGVEVWDRFLAAVKSGDEAVTGDA